MTQSHQFFSNRNNGKPVPDCSEAFGHYLSDAEQKVILLYWCGYSTEEIAGKLGCETSTVRSHKTNIRNKLNLFQRIDLEKWCWLYYEDLKKYYPKIFISSP